MHKDGNKGYGGKRREGANFRAILFAVLFVALAAPLQTMAESQLADAAPVASLTNQPALTLPALAKAKRNFLVRFFCKPDWEQALSECTSPKDVCRMVEKHVSYREEAVDQWTSARETWERGYGDCEDFAICIQTMCRELGFDVSVQLFYTLSPALTGHAIATGANSDGSLWLSSNGSFEKAASSKEIAARVADILWCDDSRMWNVMLADAEVDRLVSSGASLNTAGIAPVAVSAQ